MDSNMAQKKSRCSVADAFLGKGIAAFYFWKGIRIIMFVLSLLIPSFGSSEASPDKKATRVTKEIEALSRDATHETGAAAMIAHRLTIEFSVERSVPFQVVKAYDLDTNSVLSPGGAVRYRRGENAFSVGASIASWEATNRQPYITFPESFLRANTLQIDLGYRRYFRFLSESFVEASYAFSKVDIIEKDMNDPGFNSKRVEDVAHSFLAALGMEKHFWEHLFLSAKAGFQASTNNNFSYWLGLAVGVDIFLGQR